MATDNPEIEKRRRRSFAVLLRQGLICGLLVTAVLLLQSVGVMPTFEDDAATDGMMRAYSGVGAPKHTYPFVLIAVDGETYRQWKEPLITPRDKLAEIVTFAVQGGAKLIFLDVDLSRDHLGGRVPPGSAPGDCKKLGTADASLCEALSNAGDIPVILARTIVDSEQIHGARWKTHPSFLDNAVATPAVLWASPLYSLDPDRFVRQLRGWEIACEAGRLRAYPSVETLAVAILAGKEKGRSALERAMTSRSGGGCNDNKDPEKADDSFDLPVDNSDDKPVRVTRQASGPAERIFFTIPWEPTLSRIYPEQGTRAARQQVDIPGTDTVTDVLKVYSARHIVDPIEKPDPKSVQGHVVVVGATHAEAGDLHETPLGLMPGALVIINAIHSLLAYSGLMEPPVWQKFLFAMAIVTVTVIAYNYLWQELAAMAVPLLIFLCVFLINIFSTRRGFWFDLAYPALVYWLIKTSLYLGGELYERAQKHRHTGRSWPRCLLLAALRYEHKPAED